MHKCVFPLLFLVACAPSPEPAPVDAPIQPLVIGKSPEMPVAAPSEESPPDGPLAGPSGPSTAQGTPTQLQITARDPRLGRPARSRALIVVEVQALEQLFAATPTTAPDRPKIARRLAESYAELERTGNDALLQNARKAALKYYELITVEAPKDPKIDEVYYYVGLEHELSGDLTAARKAYFQLISKAPASKLVPLAYFAFGEMFFAEAQTDASKIDLANQAFKEVLKYPPQTNPVYVEAQHRLAQIAAMRGSIRP